MIRQSVISLHERLQLVSMYKPSHLPLIVLVTNPYLSLTPPTKNRSRMTPLTQLTNQKANLSEKSLANSSPQKPVVHDSSVQVRSPDAAVTCEQQWHWLPDSSQWVFPFSRGQSNPIPTQTILAGNFRKESLRNSVVDNTRLCRLVRFISTSMLFPSKLLDLISIGSSMLLKWQRRSQGMAECGSRHTNRNNSVKRIPLSSWTYFIRI